MTDKNLGKIITWSSFTSDSDLFIFFKVKTEKSNSEIFFAYDWVTWNHLQSVDKFKC